MHVYFYLMPNLLNSPVKIKGPIKSVFGSVVAVAF